MQLRPGVFTSMVSLISRSKFVVPYAVMVAVAMSGCGSQPSLPSNSSSTSKTDTPSKSEPKSDVPSDAQVVPDAGKQDSGAVTSVNQTPPVTEPVTQAQAPKAIDRVDVAQAVPKITSPVKKTPPAPTAEQLAQWAVTDAPKLRLLSCYDDFGDVLVQSMAVAADGSNFALGGAKLTLWKITESQPTTDLLQDLKEREVERPIRAVAISPDGQWLAAGDQKGTLRVWTLADTKLVTTIRAHDARLTQLAFSPNSQTLATTSYGGEVRLWQVPEAKRIKSFKASEQEIVRLAFLTDALLACASSETNIWNVETGQKETALTHDYVRGPAIGLSSDRAVLAFQDAESQIQFWDVAKASPLPHVITGAEAYLIEFSSDGKRIAVACGDACVRIYDVATGRVLQVLDAYGDRTSAIRWLPVGDALVIASQNGRVRIWGTEESVGKLNIVRLEQPQVAAPSPESKVPYVPAQNEQIIDLRSFPRLPGAVSRFGEYHFASYSANATVADAEAFYRHFLSQAGWVEKTKSDPADSSLTFEKLGTVFSVMLMANDPARPVKNQQSLQVTLMFSGNTDVRTLPQVEAVPSKGVWSSFSSSSYRTKLDLTDLEVTILKEYHKAGWTAYSPLTSAMQEDPNSRMMTFVQGGSLLTVSLGRPADAPSEWFVQTSATVSNKTLPIPADSGWVEFDSSTEISLVANTKMNLNQTVEFYDQRMAAEGWLARNGGRNIKEDKAWLPYLRGQQDLLVRLVALPESGTRVIVGDAEKTSWQLHVDKKSDAKSPKPGLEAADFPVPKDAINIKFDSDQKEIRFDVPKSSPVRLAEELAKELEPLNWKKDGAGLVSEEYTFITLKNEKPEIQIRIRAQGTTSSAMVGGDGFLWTKPLPTAPVRVSYATWLRRDRKPATLDLLDRFTEEMHKIPASAGASK